MNDKFNYERVKALLEKNAEFITDSSKFTENDRLDMVEDIRDLLEYLGQDGLVLFTFLKKVENKSWLSSNPNPL